MSIQMMAITVLQMRLCVTYTFNVIKYQQRLSVARVEEIVRKVGGRKAQSECNN